MADDIAEAHLAWMIDLAEQGDGELLAKHLRENGQAEPA
jgi:hypothetical protein